MRLLTPLLSFFFLITVSAQSWAEYSDPVGIWDVTGKASLRARFSGLSFPGRPEPQADMVQFHDDGSYSRTALFAIDGQWQARKKKHYRVTYDPSLIGHASPPDLAYRMADQFYALMTQTFGKEVGAAVVIQDVAIKSYTDSGTLRSKGLKLRGLATVRAQIDFIIPVSKKSRTVTARINYRFRYKGDRTSAPSECCSSDDPAQDLAESQSFLSANARLPKVQQTPSGLQYRVIRKGTGGRPSATDAVTVNYRGMLPSGQVFDSNEGISFRLDGVIPGWAEGLQLMREGGYYRFYLPPELAYGERGTGAIKPNSALIFDVELVGTGGG